MTSAEVCGFPGKTKAGELSVFAREACPAGAPEPRHGAQMRLLAPCLHDIPDELSDPVPLVSIIGQAPNGMQDTRVRARHLDMLVNPDRLVHAAVVRAQVRREVAHVAHERMAGSATHPAVP